MTPVQVRQAFRIMENSFSKEEAFVTIAHELNYKISTLKNMFYKKGVYKKRVNHFNEKSYSIWVENKNNQEKELKEELKQSFVITILKKLGLWK